MADALDMIDTASFRGVEFLVPGRTREGGRRGDTAEQPHSDIPRTSDLGRRARTFRVQGQIFTHDDGGAQRDALIDALEAFGPGRYVDPWGRQWRVKCDRWSVQESTSRGGLAEFQIEFAEDGEQQQTVTSRADTAAGATSAAATLAAAARTAFAASYKYSGVPEYVRAAGPGVLADFAAGVLPDASAWGISDALALSDAVALLDTGSDPSAIADGVAGSLAAVSEVLPTDSQRTRFLLTAAGTEADPVELAVSTANRQAEAANARATAALIRRLALAQLAADTPSIEWDSRSGAQEFSVSAADAYQAEMSRAGGRVAGESSQAVFRALASASAAVTADASQRGAALASLTTQRLDATTPAAVLAYRLYDDATRAADIAARNGVADINRLPAYRNLEVLSA